MSYADSVFIQNCRDILDHGFSDADLEVRPRWDDGTPAHTKKLFGIVNRYNLQEEFPVLTLRRQFLKSAVDELLWIYQKKSNNIHDLASHVWDQWADPKGSIGKAYGYQMSVKHMVKGVDPDKAKDYFGENSVYRLPDIPGVDQTDPQVMQRLLQNNVKAVMAHLVISADGKRFYMDQMDSVLYDLTFNPASRRILTTTYIPSDLAEMNLQPCAYSMTFNVSGNVLNGILNQRSQDMLTANGWNVMQYAALLTMVARATHLIPGELVHVIADCHIYDRHIPLVEEILDWEPYDAPRVTFTPATNDFYAMSKTDFAISDYQYHELDEKIPVAV